MPFSPNFYFDPKDTMPRTYPNEKMSLREYSEMSYEDQSIEWHNRTTYMTYLEYFCYFNNKKPDSLDSFKPPYSIEWLPKGKPRCSAQFITLTRNPTKNCSLDDMEDQFEKILSRVKKLQITLLWYSKEHWLTDSNPHIHLYINSVKKIYKSQLDNWQKYIGNVDVQPAKGNEFAITDYLSKENEIIKFLP